MNIFIFTSFLLAFAAATPTGLIEKSALLYSTPIVNQYHSQDQLGQYVYGYNGGLSSKVESRTLDGVTRGSYSYIDADNILQTVEYTADATNGFRAAATNLPKAPIHEALPLEPMRETPEVAKARAEHMAAFERINNEHRQIKEAEPFIAVRASETPATPFIAVRASETPAFSYSYAAPATYAYNAPYYTAFSLQPYSYYPQPIFTHPQRLDKIEPLALSFQQGPAETIEVAQAKAKHFEAVEEQKRRIAAAQ